MIKNDKKTTVANALKRSGYSLTRSEKKAFPVSLNVSSTGRITADANTLIYGQFKDLLKKKI